MRVFVTGGTGAVRRHTIPALVQQGHTVTALARTPAKATAALTAQGATAVLVSLFDRAALAAAFAGHDAVINLASAIPPMRRWMSAKVWRNNDRVRTEGSAAVVDAALAADVGRVVQESVSMPTGSRRRREGDRGPLRMVLRAGRRPQRAAARAGPPPLRPGAGAG